MMSCEKIRKIIEKEVDIKYQKFSASLLPSINNVLGVRVPILKKIAKEIYKSGDFLTFLKTKEFLYMEEYLLKGMLIGLLKNPINEVLFYVKDFVPSIDNWAVCDGFCCGLKITKNNLPIVWDFIQPYFLSKQEYELRFAYVMLLNYYLLDEYIDEVFKLIDSFNDDRYYSRMSVAWLVSICYIKYPQKTEKYLKYSKLDDWTFNKSIQKICESLKVDVETKNRLKKFKKINQ